MINLTEPDRRHAVLVDEYFEDDSNEFEWHFPDFTLSFFKLLEVVVLCDERIVEETLRA